MSAGECGLLSLSGHCQAAAQRGQHHLLKVGSSSWWMGVEVLIQALAGHSLCLGGAPWPCENSASQPAQSLPAAVGTCLAMQSRSLLPCLVYTIGKYCSPSLCAWSCQLYFSPESCANLPAGWRALRGSSIGVAGSRACTKSCRRPSCNVSWAHGPTS